MATPFLSTKLFIPSSRPNLVTRPRLITRMDNALHSKLTLVSAPAGFGKTTLVTAWIAGCPQSVAWLALDAGENDPIGFLSYLTASVQTIEPAIGVRVLAQLQSPQPPAPPTILATLLNEIAAIPRGFVLVLDDYHVIENQVVDELIASLVEYMPPQMHLIITTREDPPIALAKLRARGQLTEIRAADLRFTAAEAADFLNRAMGLNLSTQHIAALETRTEGWIAGLQLAALSIQGNKDAQDFVESFTGSHRYVMDYLVEEVLQQQPAQVQTFLLRTSILERMCGPLCDAVAADTGADEAPAGAETLAYLERANLFLIPLDDERRWYRYHHLFADLLRQRLAQQEAAAVAVYHVRAAHWYAAQDLELEAFHHATAAQDVALAIRLIEAKRMPLNLRGGAAPILNWLKTLSPAVLDANPVLWITYASALLIMGQVVGVEEKAAAAEAALQNAEMNARNRDLIGRIASIRATVAVTQHQTERIIEQAQRAFAFLHPDNLPARASVQWTLAYAYHLQGKRAAAVEAYTAALTACRAVGHKVIAMMSAIGLGTIQEQQTLLHLARATYQSAVDELGDAAAPPICDAYLGLARISHEWNDLDAALAYGEKSLVLARQIERTDRAVLSEVFLARLQLARGDVNGALAQLTAAEAFARRHHYEQCLPDIIAAQVIALLRQNKIAAAQRLIEGYDLPLCRARIALAQANPTAALAILAPWHAAVAAKDWADERLKTLILQSLAHHAHGNEAQALAVLAQVLAQAEPNGYLRLFVDEGTPMARLLSVAQVHGLHPTYTTNLLADFPSFLAPTHPHSLPDPLSDRELEILALIVAGLKNQEIADRLIISLNTVLYHTKNIYGKLGVNTRALAIHKARTLDLV